MEPDFLKFLNSRAPEEARAAGRVFTHFFKGRVQAEIIFLRAGRSRAWKFRPVQTSTSFIRKMLIFCKNSHSTDNYKIGR